MLRSPIPLKSQCFYELQRAFVHPPIFVTITSIIQPRFHVFRPNSCSSFHSAASITATQHRRQIRSHTRNGRRKRQNWWKGRAERGNRKESEVALGQSWSSGEIIFVFVVARRCLRNGRVRIWSEAALCRLRKEFNIDCLGSPICLHSSVRRIERVASKTLISLAIILSIIRLCLGVFL